MIDYSHTPSNPCLCSYSNMHNDKHFAGGKSSLILVNSVSCQFFNRYIFNRHVWLWFSAVVSIQIECKKILGNEFPCGKCFISVNTVNYTWPPSIYPKWPNQPQTRQGALLIFYDTKLHVTTALSIVGVVRSTCKLVWAFLPGVTWYLSWWHEKLKPITTSETCVLPVCLHGFKHWLFTDPWYNSWRSLRHKVMNTMEISALWLLAIDALPHPWRESWCSYCYLYLLISAKVRKVDLNHWLHNSADSWNKAAMMVDSLQVIKDTVFQWVEIFFEVIKTWIHCGTMLYMASYCFLKVFCGKRDEPRRQDECGEGLLMLGHPLKHNAFKGFLMTDMSKIPL